MTDLKMNNYRIPYYNFFEVCNRLNVIGNNNSYINIIII